jgi:ORF6N domain-containing protein
VAKPTVVPTERIERAILLLRGHKVMLDSELAALFGVETKVLNQAVSRNIARFPADFMFQLTEAEATLLRSQSVTLKPGRGRHRKYLPYAFTEQGVAMLSTVLRSPRAVQVNIEIMRAFVRLRGMLASHADLARKLAELERKYDAQFKVVFDAIRELMAPPENPRRSIGFRVDEARPDYGRPRRRRIKGARQAVGDGRRQVPSGVPGIYVAGLPPACCLLSTSVGCGTTVSLPAARCELPARLGSPRVRRLRCAVRRRGEGYDRAGLRSGRRRDS